MTKTTVAAVPLEALDDLALLREVPFQSSAGWWRCVVRAGLPSSARARFLLVSQDGRAVLLMPLMVIGNRTESLTTPYTCLYQPPASSACDFEAAGALLGKRFGPVLRLDAIDPAWPGWDGLSRGWGRAGRSAMRFDGFANWREPMLGRGWTRYLADRPGTLRETIRRRLGKAERDPGIAITVFGPGDAVTSGFAAYEAVHERSWKPPEPFPNFLRACSTEAASRGVLRIAVLTSQERPLAAQWWTVEGGVATLHKLVHDEAAGALSPGTVLTAWMIRRLIEEEHVRMLDFGRGDDPYKRSWTTERHVRAGMLIVDPLSVRGSLTMARQRVGAAWRRLAPGPGR